MRRSTNSMGNPNLKVKGFDFWIFCKKKLCQNMLDRGSMYSVAGTTLLTILFLSLSVMITLYYTTVQGSADVVI